MGTARWADSRRSQIALAVVAALLATTGGAVVWIREQPTAVSLDDAVAQFRSAPATAAPDAGAGPVSAPAAPEPGDAQPAADPGAHPPAAADAPAAVPAPPAGGAAPTPEAGPPAPGSRWPDEGVYAFRTRGGGETNALGGARHDYPADTPVTVRRAGCGYTVHWQPLNERWDEWEFCPGAGEQEASRPMVRISTYHEFFQRGQRQDFDCGRTEMLPAGQPPGSRYSWTCRSAAGGTVEATTTVVGVETLDIGGAPVQALHSRHEAVFKGANEGSQVFEWWVHLETGLPIHMTRTLNVKSNSPFGKVDYAERFTSTATSLTPRR